MNDPIAINAISPIGFGCYRVMSGNSEHYAALIRALSLGCTLIDTASNYGDGRSEQLAGDVLADHPEFNAFVMTKAGYISPTTERQLLEVGISPALMLPLSAESKYSLAPEVLREQIEISLQRLRRTHLDGLLLHNPEHYFDCDGVDKTREGFERTLREAMTFLEEAVNAGRIRYYGISSNTLATNTDNQTRIELRFLLETAKSIASDHHFRLIEFPFNLMETEASCAGPNGPSLIDQIRDAGLISLANRPLNSLNGQESLRFATYDDELRGLNDAEAVEAFEACVDLIRRQLDHGSESFGVMDFPIMKFLRDNGFGIEHPDTVDQIFNRHFYPFVDRVWDGTVPPSARLVCARVHQFARLYAKRALSTRSSALRKELIGADDSRSFAVSACEFGLNSGMDHVLVGMRTPAYVESLKELILPAAPDTRDQLAVGFPTNSRSNHR
jgi:aryl-alcohol dehydrogenase-like predicted oxidoreductase